MMTLRFPLYSALTVLLLFFASAYDSHSQTVNSVTYPEYLGAPEGFEEHSWGTDIALQGDTLFISSPALDESQTGAVHQYIFNGTDWDLNQTIESPNEEYDRFGASIAVADSLLAVGAPEAANDEGIQSGRLYVYLFNEDSGNWEHGYSFSPEYPQEGEKFGFSVAADSGRILAGAPERDFIDEVQEDTTENIGRAYSYDFTWDRRDGEVPESRINISMNRENERFGYDLDIKGTWAVVATSPDGLSAISAPNRFSIIEQHRLANPGWNTRETVSQSDGPHNGIGTVAIAREAAFVAPPATRTSFAVAFNFDPEDEANILDHQQLNPSNDRAHQMFGQALATNDYTAAVGGRDMVDFFQWNEDSWTRSHIAHADTLNDMQFGTKVDFNDHFVIVNGVMGVNEDRTAKVFWMNRDEITSGEPPLTETSRPSEVELHNAYPNPFNPVTEIQYTLPEAEHIRLEVYDMTGRKISLLADGHQQAGQHSVTFDGTRLSSGVYIYRLTAGDLVLSHKMTLIK